MSEMDVCPYSPLYESLAILYHSDERMATVEMIYGLSATLGEKRVRND